MTAVILCRDCITWSHHRRIVDASDHDPSDRRTLVRTVHAYERAPDRILLKAVELPVSKEGGSESAAGMLHEHYQHNTCFVLRRGEARAYARLAFMAHRISIY